MVRNKQKFLRRTKKMRIVTIPVTYVKPVPINGVITKEEFEEIFENKVYKTIIVSIKQYDSDDYLVRNIKQTIDGDKYDLLMSESPEFAEGKPENEYREVDLWHIIDLIREEQKSLDQV